jgi:hypothetical protein
LFTTSGQTWLQESFPDGNAWVVDYETIARAEVEVIAICTTSSIQR